MPMEDKKLSDATRILQKFASLIKEKSTKHLVKSFLELGLTKNNVYNSMSFEELVALLRTKKVIQTTKHVFQRFLKLAAAMESDKPTEERPEAKINIRIVLAMYMIVCFPGSVFGGPSVLATELTDAARLLLDTFEELMKLVVETPDFSIANLPISLLSRFRAETTDYLAKFSAWRVPDELGLVCRIQQALLVIILEQAKCPPGSPHLPAFTEQRERLAAKLTQLRGAGAVELVEATARVANMDLNL